MAPAQASVFVAPDKAGMPGVLNALIMKICTKSIDDRGRFIIALSGGSLPAFMSTLSESFTAEGIDPRYSCWHVILADERCVPETDPDNNMKAIKEKFLSKASIPESQIYSIDESKLSESADAVATEYEARLKPLMASSAGMLDLALLGFGPDGHTCSLFPEHALLSESSRWVAPITDSPKPPSNRITLTLPVLNSKTRHVIFCGAGASKKPILQAVFAKIDTPGDGPVRVVYSEPPPYPCAMVVPSARTEDSLMWVVDSDALPSATGSGCDIGLYGLAVMGQNFALNMADHGFKVCVGNRSHAKVEATVKRAKEEGNLPLIGSSSPADFCAKLAKPRKIVILVQAGKPVDLTIAALAEHLEEGDLIVDGGNEWFPNQIRRFEELKSKGIMFVGMGISGGEEGARNGPSLMPGGPKEAYDLIEPIIMKCAAKVGDGEACTGYCGPIGSGNYVKMIHNGIEYADMQLIGEVYDLLKHVGGMSNDEMAALFNEWNTTELDSYLIEITAKVFARKDDLEDTGYVVDKVLDKIGMKGTGRWTVQEAAEHSVAAPIMAAALDSRYISGRKEERVAASKVLKGPSAVPPAVSRDQMIDDLKAALYCAKVASYAQGLNVIKAASDHYGWDVDLALCANMWRGGCIIRAGLLGKIKDAMANDTNLANLMVDPTFAEELNSRAMSWRRIVGLGISNGIALPAMSTALSYFDQYRRESLPANLIQAQRDFFGGHTYQRTDREGTFHCLWDETHKDIGDLTGRTAGEL